MKAPHLVVGVTSAQTCLVFTGWLRSLREAGFRVTLISSPGELLGRTAAAEGVDHRAVSMQRRIAPLSDLVSLFRLWRVLRGLQPDLVEFSTPKAGLLGALAARLCGVPVRVYLLRGLKLESASGLKRRVLLAAERLAAACVHAVVCNSESLRAQALDLRIAPAAKLHVLGDGSSRGVDADRFSPGATPVRKQFGILPGAPVVGFVGRLTRDKGVRELVDAFASILDAAPGAHLLLVGWFDESEDALDARLRARILQHPRIHYTGLVSDTAPYYRAMDVLVLPTWREGFPNVVLEAGASGLPVVTTLATGSRDAVLPEVTGLLIPPGYPEALRDALLRLLRDPALCRRMGAAARKWIMEHYAGERVAGLTAAFYQELLLGASRRRRASGPAGE